jgi:TPR repeat protein
VASAVLASGGYFFGFERCEDQLAYDYSPYCLKCNEKNAEGGDAGAAYNLALFFEGRDSKKSNNWIRIAAERGDRRAVARALTECEHGKLFSYKDSEKILLNATRKDPSGLALDAMYFYLGGNCGPLNLEEVRRFYLTGTDDDVNLCSVAQKYGEVVVHENTVPVDRKNALELLQQCVRKADSDSAAYREASRLLGVLNMTTRNN